MFLFLKSSSKALISFVNEESDWWLATKLPQRRLSESMPAIITSSSARSSTPSRFAFAFAWRVSQNGAAISRLPSPLLSPRHGSLSASTSFVAEIWLNSIARSNRNGKSLFGISFLLVITAPCAICVAQVAFALPSTSSKG